MSATHSRRVAALERASLADNMVYLWCNPGETEAEVIFVHYGTPMPPPGDRVTVYAWQDQKEQHHALQS